MSRRWVAIHDRARAAALVRALAPVSDVYCGVAPRTTRETGGVAAIERCWALFVDCDSPAAVEALDSFTPRPSVVVASGSVTDSVAHRQAYWSLREPLSPEHQAQACRRLAHVLDADMRATDAARILRPAASLNWKTDPPRRVECVELECVSYTAADVVGKLGDPQPERPLAPIASRRLDDDDPLRMVGAETYIPALSGREVGRDHKAICPFHTGGQERMPSLHAYPDGGWFCYACEQGGSVYDFASRVWNIPTRDVAVTQSLHLHRVGVPGGGARPSQPPTFRWPPPAGWRGAGRTQFFTHIFTPRNSRR